MKLKICHVTSVHKSTDIRIFEKECSSLAKNEKYSVFLVAKGDSYQKNNVSVIGLGTPPNGRVRRMFQFAKKIAYKALEIDADIYHFHDPELLRFVPLFKKHRKVVIFDSHEDVADSILDKDYIPRFERRIVASVYRRFADRMMRRCNALISVTPHIVEKLKKINDSVSLITNFPIINASTDATSNDSTVGPRNSGSIVFAGGVSPQWSHHIILPVIDTIQGVQYHLYGPSTKGYLEDLKKLPGWDKTYYHGSVPFQEVQTALSKAGISIVLLQPSHNTAGLYGTIGNTKLFESMNAGLPVICTNFMLWKDIVETSRCGLCVSPNSKEELRKAISFLIEHPEIAKEMGMRGKKLVQEMYNWETQEKELFCLYSKLETAV